MSSSERRDYSSNFPPGLVIENIPGLSFEGYNRKPNRRIAVEHVVSSGEELALDEEGNDDLCPTESTTSRFEKAEKLVEANREKVAASTSFREVSSDESEDA